MIPKNIAKVRISKQILYLQGQWSQPLCFMECPPIPIKEGCLSEKQVPLHHPTSRTSHAGRGLGTHSETSPPRECGYTEGGSH